MTTTARVVLEADSRQVKTATNDLNAFDGAGKRAATSAKGVAKATDGIAVSARRGAVAVAGFATTLGLGIVAQQSITAARQFGAALSEVSTLVQGTDKEMQFLRQSSLELSKTYGGTATSQAKAFYQAISAGAGDAADAAKLLDVANKLAVGGVTDVTTAVDGLTTALNAYQMDADAALSVSDTMFVGMRAGKTTIAELSTALGQVVPIAASAGVSFEEVVAATSALTTQGQTTSVAVTGLRQVIAGVIKPAKEASEMAKALGLEFDSQALAAKGLAGFLEDVVAKTGGNQDAMAALFGSVEALNAALAFAGGAGATFSQIMDEMTAKAGSTDAAFDKMAEDLDQRLNVVMGRFGGLVAEGGQALLTIMVPAMEAAATMAEVLAGSLDHLVMAVVALAATQIPALVVGLAGATVGILSMVNGLNIALVAAAALTGAMRVLGGAVALAGGPWGILAGLVAGAATYFLAFRDNAETAETATYNAADATAALNTALGTFHSTAAPTAGRAAIELANNNYKLAESALAAASAEIAKMEAAEASVRNIIANNGGRVSMEVASMLDAQMARLFANRLRAEKAITRAMIDRNKAARAVTGATSEQMTATQKLNSKIEVTVDGINNLGGASKGAANDAAELTEEMSGPLTTAVDGIANAFGDFVANGFKDFKGFVKNILSSFKGMLSQMIAMSVKNKIMISLGFGGVGAAATSAASGGGGFLSNLFGGSSAAFGGVFKDGLLSGIGGSFKALGGLFSGAGSLAAAIPAIGLVAAGLSLFITKTKTLDTGLRITTDSMDTLVDKFALIEKSRFMGLIKSKSTNYAAMSAEEAAPFIAAVNNIKDGVKSAAGTMNIGARTFRDFSHAVSVSTAGMTDEQAQKAVADALEGMADKMAAMALSGRNVIRDGEGAATALTRLSTALATSNDAFGVLGHTLYAASIRGADMASTLVDLFGGVDKFTAATSQYFEMFYSDAEKVAAGQRQISKAMAEFGAAVPMTRDQYRAMVDAQDLATERGRALYSVLVGMASTFDLVLPAAKALTSALQGAVDVATPELDTLAAHISSLAQTARASARDWYSASNAIRATIDNLNNSSLTVLSLGQRNLLNQSGYQSAVRGVKHGDLSSAQALPEAAKAYLETARKTASSRVDYARIESKVRSGLALASGISGMEGSAEDVMASLYEQQIDILGQLNAYLTSGEPIKARDLKSFQSDFSSLGKAIRGVELFDYAKFQKGLKVAISGIKAGDLPKQLQRLLIADTKGLRVAVDTVLSDPGLGHDIRFITMNRASDHVSNISTVLAGALKKKELKTLIGDATDLTATITSIIGKGGDLSARQLRKLLGGQSIRFAGGVTLDPGDAFQTLESTLGGSFARFGTTLDSGFANPSKLLGAQIDQLKEAVNADAAMRKQHNQQATLNNIVSQLSVNAKGKQFVNSDALSSMAAAIGLDMSGMGAKSALNKIRDFSGSDLLTGYVHDPNGSKLAAYQKRQSGSGIDDGTGRLYKRKDFKVSRGSGEYGDWFNVKGPLGGTRNFDILNKPGMETYLEKVMFGVVPAFANGGAHAGGLRLVGEHGPEIEATGPSRIVSHGETKRMLDNREVVAELRRLRAEVSELRDERAAAARVLIRHAKTSADLAEKSDTQGSPPARAAL